MTRIIPTLQALPKLSSSNPPFPWAPMRKSKRRSAAKPRSLSRWHPIPNSSRKARPSRTSRNPIASSLAARTNPPATACAIFTNPSSARATRFSSWIFPRRKWSNTPPTRCSPPRFPSSMKSPISAKRTARMLMKSAAACARINASATSSSTPASATEAHVFPRMCSPASPWARTAKRPPRCSPPCMK